MSESATPARDAELREALAGLRREIRSRFASEPETASAAPSRQRRADAPRFDLSRLEKPLRSIRQRAATLGMREHAHETDDFGMDPEAVEALRPWLDRLYDRYWRVEVEGLEALPEGPLLLVANRSGLLPWDGLMIAHAVERARGARPRFAVADWLMAQPFAQPRLARIGAVRACPENALRLLRSGRSVVAFPEGARGATKPFRERYRVQRFGRGGAVRVALEGGAPLVPVGVVGAEEAHPILYKATGPARALGLPFLPVTPSFPWFGPLGALPLPTKWRIHFGEPFALGQLRPDALGDELLLSRLSDELRVCVQELVDEALRARPSVWG